MGDYTYVNAPFNWDVRRGSLTFDTVEYYPATEARHRVRYTVGSQGEWTIVHKDVFDHGWSQDHGFGVRRIDPLQGFWIRPRVTPLLHPDMREAWTPPSWRQQMTRWTSHKDMDPSEDTGFFDNETWDFMVKFAYIDSLSEVETAVCHLHILGVPYRSSLFRKFYKDSAGSIFVGI